MLRILLLFAFVAISTAVECSMQMNIFDGSKTCATSTAGVITYQADAGECKTPTGSTTFSSFGAALTKFKWNSDCTVLNTWVGGDECNGSPQNWFVEGNTANCGVPGTPDSTDGHGQQCIGRTCTFSGTSITTTTTKVDGAAALVPHFLLALICSVLVFLA
eukprot:TRINITY_DN85245_c0_g1_i1.p2 TRINITY_DN85245_c0_g1~~TRINITY_DN85245_c0_g1_i1.p2  ORF type:complete len:181 (-),score=25.80 TRINITY_DN85245_c0_g1_i1:105-587(-)